MLQRALSTKLENNSQWEKIFANHISAKGCVIRIYEKPLLINIKRQIILFLNGQMILVDIFPKADIQIISKYMKRHSILLVIGEMHVTQWDILVVVQSLSHVWLFVTLWIATCQASLSFTNSWSLLKFMSIESAMPSNHLILCHPLLLPSVFPSNRVFFRESAICIRWPKYWSFSFSISPSNESVQPKGWFPLGLTGLTSLLSNGLSRIFSNTTVWRH